MNALVRPVFQPDVRELCWRPYHNHPKGCPNYGKRPSCPPAAKLLPELIHVDRPIYAIWTRFNLAKHVKKLGQKHPDWSSRQLRCCLYWQGTARKKLREEIAAFKYCHTGLRILMCPEANGVNVTATMQSIGITLLWPPIKWAYQVVLAGDWK